MLGQIKQPQVQLGWTPKSWMMRLRSLPVSAPNIEHSNLNLYLNDMTWLISGHLTLFTFIVLTTWQHLGSMSLLFSYLQSCSWVISLLDVCSPMKVECALTLTETCGSGSKWIYFKVTVICYGADEKVSGELKKNIMQGRLDKKLTQAQLAQVCHRGDQYWVGLSSYLIGWHLWDIRLYLRINLGMVR